MLFQEAQRDVFSSLETPIHITSDGGRIGRLFWINSDPVEGMPDWGKSGFVANYLDLLNFLGSCLKQSDLLP